MFFKPIHVAIVVLASGLAPLSSVDAATSTRYYSQNGGSACTGALPTYEGALRKRPKAIANEGTTTAYITCSALNTEASPDPSLVWAYFTNRNATPATVNCTMVDGNEFYGSTAFPLSKVYAAGEFSIMLWEPTAPATAFRSSVSLSCALPPGVELNFFNHEVEEEIGT